jgi:Uma2 family endonuclease
MSTAVPSQIGFGSLPLAPAPVRRFTVDEYHRMIETGVLTSNDRVQLIDGWIIEMPPIGPPHASVTSLAAQVIQSGLSSGCYVRSQLPITLRHSEPEPDIVVARGGIRDYAKRHPGPDEVALVAEVADSTLQFDRQQKLKIYAADGIAVYWIINVADRQVEVFSDPDTTKQEYRRREVIRDQGTVDLIIDGKKIAQLKVADLLP